MDSNKGIVRWQDLGNFILGFWLYVSPWVLDYPSDSPRAAGNAFLLGGAIMLIAAYAVYSPRLWEEGLNTAFGIWMIASPWALEFVSHTPAAVHAGVVGVMVAILAIWAIASDINLERWSHEHGVVP
jgi:hypothetical protein